MRNQKIIVLCLLLVLMLPACASRQLTGAGRAQVLAALQGQEAPQATIAPSPSPTPDPAAPAPSSAPTGPDDTPQLPEGYVSWGTGQVVEHLYFHPVIAYPQFAFGTDHAQGLDNSMLTVDEFSKILQSLYDNDYVLVSMNDVWRETEGPDGPRMERNTLMVPKGKKPLILSIGDVNYYPYMLAEGFTSKLVLGPDGDIWAYCTDPDTQEVFVTQDLDAVTILDKFVREHPDFSPSGAKGCLALTGYQGILGYRTQTDRTLSEAEQPAWEAKRQKEIQAVAPIIQRLKETGWYFGSHTWGHISLGAKSLEGVQDDTQRWLDEVGSLVGETALLFYPQGSRPDGNDVTQTGPVFQYLQEQGFRVFASTGIESYSKIKSNISAVICDRLHPDGSTLRWQQKRYIQFYDASQIMDVENRPDLGYNWTKQEGSP